MDKYRKFRSLILAFLFFLAAVGCDQISAIAEYFKKTKETPKTEIAQSPSSPVVSTDAGKQETPAVSMMGSKPQTPQAGNVLARVGNWQVTLEEFNEKLKSLKEALPDFDINNPENKKTILEELIRQQLLVLDAEKSGLAQDKNIVSAVDEFRRTMIVREIVNKITSNIKATEEEAKKFYKDNKQSIIAPAQWHVWEIIVDAQSQIKANELLVEILKGADFAATAKGNSISESAAKGGDLGFIQEAPFPEMASVLSGLEAGGVSSVFKGPKGFYIIKLEEKKGGEPLPFDQVKNEIMDQVTFDKHQQAVLEYITQLKAKTNIEVNEKLLAP